MQRTNWVITMGDYYHKKDYSLTKDIEEAEVFKDLNDEEMGKLAKKRMNGIKGAWKYVTYEKAFIDYEKRTYVDETKTSKWGRYIKVDEIKFYLNNGYTIGYKLNEETHIYTKETMPDTLDTNVVLYASWRIVEQIVVEQKEIVEEDNSTKEYIKDDSKVKMYREKLINSDIQRNKPTIYRYLNSLIEICEIIISDEFNDKSWEIWDDVRSNCGLCSNAFGRFTSNGIKCRCPWDKRGMDEVKNEMSDTCGCYYECMLVNDNNRPEEMNKDLKGFMRKYSQEFMEKQFEKYLK